MGGEICKYSILLKLKIHYKCTVNAVKHTSFSQGDWKFEKKPNNLFDFLSLIPKIGLVDKNVVAGPTRVLIEEYVLL